MGGFGSDAFGVGFDDDAFDIDRGESAGTTPSSGATVPPSTFQIDQILNSQAVDGVGKYEICQRTGFKMLPVWHPDSKFIVDGYGDYVRRKSADDRHPQDYLASGRNVPHIGPQNPEDSSNSFVSGGVLLLSGEDGYVLYSENGAIGIS